MPRVDKPLNSLKKTKFKKKIGKDHFLHQLFFGNKFKYKLIETNRL